MTIVCGQSGHLIESIDRFSHRSSKHCAAGERRGARLASKGQRNAPAAGNEGLVPGERTGWDREGGVERSRNVEREKERVGGELVEQGKPSSSGFI